MDPVLSVRLTVEEHDELERRRLTVGAPTVSDYVRRELFGVAETPSDPLWALVHLLDRYLTERQETTGRSWAAPRLG